MGRQIDGLLESCQSYLDLPVERLRTFDPGHYTDPDFYVLEVGHIWKKD